MQNGENTRQPAKVTPLRAEFLDRLGRNSNQQAVHELLVASKRIAQLRRHGRNSVKVAARQQFGLAPFEPRPGLSPMALRASPIATAVESPERLVAVVAPVKPSAQFFGAAGRDIRKGPFLRGHHHVSML